MPKPSNEKLINAVKQGEIDVVRAYRDECLAMFRTLRSYRPLVWLTTARAYGSIERLYSIYYVMYGDHEELYKGYDEASRDDDMYSYVLSAALFHRESTDAPIITAILQFCLRECGDLKTLLFAWLEKDSDKASDAVIFRVCKCLVELGVDINDVDEHGYTPLLRLLKQVSDGRRDEARQPLMAHLIWELGATLPMHHHDQAALEVMDRALFYPTKKLHEVYKIIDVKWNHYRRMENNYRASQAEVVKARNDAWRWQKESDRLASEVIHLTNQVERLRQEIEWLLPHMVSSKGTEGANATGLIRHSVFDSVAEGGAEAPLFGSKEA